MRNIRPNPSVAWPGPFSNSEFPAKITSPREEEWDVIFFLYHKLDVRTAHKRTFLKFFEQTVSLNLRDHYLYLLKMFFL